MSLVRYVVPIYEIKVHHDRHGTQREKLGRERFFQNDLLDGRFGVITPYLSFDFAERSSNAPTHLKRNSTILLRFLLGTTLFNAGCAGGSSSVDRRGAAESAPNVITVTQIPQSVDMEELNRYFTRGAIRSLQGDQPGAIRYYMAVLRIVPNHAPSLEATARSWEELEEYDSALFYARRSVEADPDDTESHRLLAQLWTEAGMFDSAAAEYEHVLTGHPNDLQAHYIIARTWERRNPDKALKHFLYIRDNIAEDFNALVGIYEIYIARRDYSKAINTLYLMLQHNPDDPILYETLCSLWTGIGQFDSAKQTLVQADLNIQDSAQLEHFIGSELTLTEIRLRSFPPFPDDLQRFAASIVELTARRLPDRPKSTYQAGMIALRLGNDTLGDSLLSRAFQSNDLSAISWTEAADIYLEHSAAKRMLAVLGPAAQNFKARGDILYQMAVAYNQIEESDSTELYLKRSVEVDPDYADAWWMLARMEIIEEKTGPGISYYERAINADPYNPELLNDYAMMLTRSRGLLGKAEELADRALGLEPENEIFLTTRGWIALLEKNYDAAVKYLQRAVSMGGATAERLELLGDALTADGQKAKGLTTYKQALRVVGEDHQRELRLKGKIGDK